MRAVALIAGIALFLVLDDRPIMAQERARFHHVRLNTTNPAKSISYYAKHFGGGADEVQRQG